MKKIIALILVLALTAAAAAAVAEDAAEVQTPATQNMTAHRGPFGMPGNGQFPQNGQAPGSSENNGAVQPGAQLPDNSQNNSEAQPEAPQPGVQQPDNSGNTDAVSGSTPGQAGNTQKPGRGQNRGGSRNNNSRFPQNGQSRNGQFPQNGRMHGSDLFIQSLNEMVSDGTIDQETAEKIKNWLETRISAGQPAASGTQIPGSAENTPEAPNPQDGQVPQDIPGTGSAENSVTTQDVSAGNG